MTSECDNYLNMTDDQIVNLLFGIDFNKKL